MTKQSEAALELKCYVCWKKVTTVDFILVSERQETDRPFVAHETCAHALHPDVAYLHAESSVTKTNQPRVRRVRAAKNIRGWLGDWPNGRPDRGHNNTCSHPWHDVVSRSQPKEVRNLTPEEKLVAFLNTCDECDEPSTHNFCDVHFPVLSTAEEVAKLSLEIRNLAHLGWKDRPNAEYLFREIGKRAQWIAEAASRQWREEK